LNKEQIFESGFVGAFFERYYEYKCHSYYPDIDRLNYAIARDNEEKKEYTLKEQAKAKDKIKELGFEELSYAYVVSCKKENGHAYIEDSKRYEYWMERFIITFEGNIVSFTQINEAAQRFFNKEVLDNECFENEDEFWDFYPTGMSPNDQQLFTVAIEEHTIKVLIEYDIEEFKKNDWWEIDFEEYEKRRHYSNPLDNLLRLSELFVQLNRWDMFNDFIRIEEEENKIISPENKIERNLTIAQIALINIYKGKIITRDNANEIAKAQGYISKNSGERLYQKYLKYHLPKDRTANDGTERKSKAKLKLLKSVVEHLQKDLQSAILTEAEQLKKTIETNY
jgi:hypothetical protein